MRKRLLRYFYMGSTPSFSPASLEPQVWYDSSVGLFQDLAGTTPAANNQIVLRWEDQSGNNYHLVGDTGGFTVFRPTYHTNQVNSLPCVRFTNQKLAVDAAGPFSTKNMSLFVVYKQRSRDSYPVVNLRSDTDFNADQFSWNNGYLRPAMYGGATADSQIGFPLSTWVVAGCVTTTTTITHHVNTRIGNAVSYTLPNDSYQGIEIGYSLVGCDIDVAELIIFQRSLSESERDDVLEYLTDKYAISTPAKVHNLVSDGNSITFGSLSNYQPYGDKAAIDAGISPYDYYRTATGGATTAQLLARYPTLIAPLYDGSVAKNIYMVWEITNHISDGTVTEAAAKTAIENLCLAAQADGFLVVTGTVVDRTTAFTNGQNTAGFRAMAASINTWLRANYTNFADALADPAANVNLQDADNTTYFVDQVHLSQTGHDQAATPFETALESVL